MSARRASRFWSNPAARAAAGATALGITASMLERRAVSRTEADLFRIINQLPDDFFVPIWPVMQLGTLGSAWAAAALARALDNRRLALRLFAAGTLTWALSKAIKRAIRRPRPSALIPETRVRGGEPTGLGYASGHAGVALVLVVAAWRDLPRSARVAAVPLAATVGFARIYVGAHLPLDVIGGLALGLTVDAFIEAALRLEQAHLMVRE